jgi:2-polyprenyl-6-methoxyphenol hydroxylase-like FAD-dependent oxidoreductase
MEKKSLHVIIIGAGTGGLCLAHGLKRAGISVAVYERDRTRKDGLQGYRVGISPAGSYALKQCLPPELYDLFVATCARPPRYFNMLTEQMSELLYVDNITGADPVESEKSVSRMTLRQVLLTGLEDIVVFDKKFSHYEHYSDGRVIVSFEDGTQAIADVLVGADGAGSRLRKQRLPHAQMEETGILSLGGKVPITPESKALLSDKVFNGISLVMAPKGYGAILHVMQFKWDRDGVKTNIGGNDAELISQWPGMLYDNTRDYIMWGVWAARRWFPVDPATLSSDEQLALAREMVSNWHPNMRKLMALTDPSTVFSVNIRTSVPLEPWESSNVTLLGDAIHTMTPGRGVGANTALRDAALLCMRLIEVHEGTKPLVAALHEYEVEMLRYSKEAVLESRKQMDANSIVHRPIIGRIPLAIARTGMRLVNVIPALKQKAIQQRTRLRDVEQVKASLGASSAAGVKSPHEKVRSGETVGRAYEV